MGKARRFRGKSGLLRGDGAQEFQPVRVGLPVTLADSAEQYRF
jgi:hypothetical protein